MGQNVSMARLRVAEAHQDLPSEFSHPLGELAVCPQASFHVLPVAGKRATSITMGLLAHLARAADGYGVPEVPIEAPTSSPDVHVVRIPLPALRGLADRNDLSHQSTSKWRILGGATSSPLAAKKHGLGDLHDVHHLPTLPTSRAGQASVSPSPGPHERSSWYGGCSVWSVHLVAHSASGKPRSVWRPSTYRPA